MTELSEGLRNLRAALGEAWRSFLDALPELGAALLLLLAGWIVARIVRALTLRLGGGVNRFLAGFGRMTHAKKRPQLSGAVLALIGNVAFWVIILLFVTLAARALGLALFTEWLDRIVAWLPTLLAGGLILLAGYYVSVVARDVVTAALESAHSPQAELFGLIAQAAIFLAAIVIGLDQVGIDITFLTTVFAIVVGGLLLSLALAFGLGATSFVGNLLGAQQLQRLLEPGQTVRIHGVEGQVIEFTPTSVILATDEGRLSVPAKLFQEEATLIVADEDDG